MDNRITVVNIGNIPRCNYRSFLCPPETRGPGDLIQQLGIPAADVIKTIVYVIKPAINIFNVGGPGLVSNAEEILSHWGDTLTAAAPRGKTTVTVLGQPERNIPSGEAFFWGDIDLLSSLQPAFVDLEQQGVHCIVLPLTYSSRKRPSSSADDDVRQHILERSDGLLASLKSLHSNRADIHDPEHTTIIPFPTLHALNSDWSRSFNTSTTIDNQTAFAYKGRRVLDRELLPTLKGLYENQGSATLGLFGTRGAGRSHLATAAASLLLSEGIPTVFLGFSSGTTPRTSVMRDAFILALATREDLKVYINHLFVSCRRHADKANPRRGIVNFADYLLSKGIKLVFIILGMDTLTDDELVDCQTMASAHVLCFTAGGNSKLRLETEDRVAGGYEKALYLNGGLGKEDLPGWLSQYETEAKTQLQDGQRELIKATTGNVPSLLSAEFRAINNTRSFDAKHLRVAIDIHSPLSDWLQELMKEWPEKTQDLKKLLVAVLGNDHLELASRFTDQRFIFRDEDDRWSSTSLLAYEAIFQLVIELQDCFQYFVAQKWAECIPLVAHNPSMLGYAIECAITNELSHGFKLEHSNLSIPQLPLFVLPPGGKPRTIVEAGIYVPVEFNPMYIDCVIVWLEEKTDSHPATVHIAPVQISNVENVSDHLNSEEQFFETSEDWKLWRDAVHDLNRQIVWDFVWIVNYPTNSSTTRPAYQGVPAHVVHTICFKTISEVIDDALKMY
ncbi:hypothetical protein B0H17DRAFT_1039220 [Mycena rosella]|uniref:Uncharacterized protein n=1 Tax=Mycena rosella TaxID=1033263 RepID=A0AAD7GSH9_MYCRO|nr:hypothetical protein B0H17DRAFT_1039220 [Mycena rosella]